MTRYSIYHPGGWYMCDIADANNTTNVPGTDRWGQRLPTFIPNPGPGKLLPQKAVSVLREAAKSQDAVLQNLILEYAQAIENHYNLNTGNLQLKLL